MKIISTQKERRRISEVLLYLESQGVCTPIEREGDDADVPIILSELHLLLN